jgi:hypothetical protein
MNTRNQGKTAPVQHRASTSPDARAALRRMLRDMDAAPVARQPDLQAALARAAAAAGTSVETLRAWACGPRQYAFNDLAGCVVQRRSRRTGTLAGLYEAQQAGLDPDAGRWVTVCEDHATCVNHETLAAARAHLPDPGTWCEACRGAASARDE